MIDHEGHVWVGTEKLLGATNRIGVFFKAFGPPGEAEPLFDSAAPPDLDNPHVDATACLALASDGSLLRVFQTEEAGKAHALSPDGFELWEGGEPFDIRRTDLISVAMGRDGTIYVGTRWYPFPFNTNGRVFALWGFDE